ncbi:hypothetical protein ACQR35_10950 [Pseudarthrobacter sp. J1738]|uniref:hypothetical protein n=1 Tax=Pseudarthrobacter sp. J1738 TaxID=3420446 RepID=UPI003D26F4F4
MGLLKVCSECGAVTDQALCIDHRRKPAPSPSHQLKGSSTARGYDYTWSKLSKRARQLQPFCLDCGSTSDLTADHSEEAWARKARGQVIRLEDITVVCRPCNSKRGAARGGELGLIDASKDPRAIGKVSDTPGIGYFEGGGK